AGGRSSFRAPVLLGGLRPHWRPRLTVPAPVNTAKPAPDLSQSAPDSISPLPIHGGTAGCPGRLSYHRHTKTLGFRSRASRAGRRCQLVRFRGSTCVAPPLFMGHFIGVRGGPGLRSPTRQVTDPSRAEEHLV